MQGKEWLQIDPDTFPVGIANFNLYLSYWGNKASEDAKGLITWKHKESMNGYPIVTWDPKVRRPYKLREHFMSNDHTCARFQDPHK